MEFKESSLAKRLASYRDPKPRNPKILKKNSKITPDPDPKFLEKNSKNTKVTQKILFSCIFSIFEFFFRNLGSGPGGVIFDFFSRIFGFRGFGSL